jgi:hypothetical protein
MDIIIDEIQIVDGKNCFVIINQQNDCFFRRVKETGIVTFRDSFGNYVQNHFATLKFLDKDYHLTKEGHNVRLSDGTIFVLLSRQDILEIAQNAFYTEGQTRIYDFICQKFTVEL